MDRNGTTVTGELTVDRARIQVPDESRPQLGDDVVVRNAPGVASTDAERKAPPPASQGGGAGSIALARSARSTTSAFAGHGIAFARIQGPSRPTTP